MLDAKVYKSNSEYVIIIFGTLQKLVHRARQCFVLRTLSCYATRDVFYNVSILYL
jgi:hypothetical protein